MKHVFYDIEGGTLSTLEYLAGKNMVKKLFFLSIVLFTLAILIFLISSENWERHIIADQTSPIYLFVKDMDGDNDPDVASTTNRHPLRWDSEVAWFRNNLD